MTNPQDSWDLIVVGGGAAGYFTAITCAESAPGARILILEQGKEVLNKVRISGGGRCNVTHACFDPNELVDFYPRGQKALLGPFHHFCTGDTMGWYEDRGVPLKIEEDGRVFPQSDSSQSIIDCLQKAARRSNIRVQTQSRVVQFYPPESKGQAWKVMLQSGDDYYAQRLLIASGSSKKVWDLIGHLGHKIVPPVPSLFTFNCKDERIKGLPGLSVPQAQVNILKTDFEAAGPLLITHWGFSGPGVLKLSAWAARDLQELEYRFQITINWIAGQSVDWSTWWHDKRQLQGKKKIQNDKSFGLPGRLWERLVTAAKIRPEQKWAELSKAQQQALETEITAGEYQIQGKSTFKEEFVTAGGIHLDEVNFKSFSSRIHHGLHFAGEVLNIDAVTGGFNFQAAWTGGFLAGQAIAKGIKKDRG